MDDTFRLVLSGVVTLMAGISILACHRMWSYLAEKCVCGCPRGSHAMPLTMQANAPAGECRGCHCRAFSAKV
jgi:hypothetical protein